MSDNVDAGDYVYDRLTTEERLHLAEAMRVASLSGSNEFHDNLGNAGIPTVCHDGAQATEAQLREMCHYLSFVRTTPGQTQIDWDVLLKNAFGVSSRERVRGLYVDATGMTDQAAFAEGAR